MNKTAFITMDVESYYDTSCIAEKCIQPDSRYTCATAIASFLDLLSPFNAKATFFVSASFLVDSLSYLKRAVSEGHEIALHALKHVSPRNMNLADFKRDIAVAKDKIEQALGVRICGYRAPCFGISAEIIEAVKELGIIYDSSALNFSSAIYSGELSLDGYTRINSVAYEKDGFFEFAPCKQKFFNREIPISGGGYLRLAPWCIMKKLVSKQVNTGAFLLYVHPFELYGGELPTYSIKGTQKMFICRGRADYSSKIEKLIQSLFSLGFKLETMSQFINSYNENR